MATTASTMGTRGGAADSLPPTDVVLALAAKRWAAAHAAAIRRAEAAEVLALCHAKSLTALQETVRSMAADHAAAHALAVQHLAAAAVHGSTLVAASRASAAAGVLRARDADTRAAALAAARAATARDHAAADAARAATRDATAAMRDAARAKAADRRAALDASGAVLRGDAAVLAETALRAAVAEMLREHHDPDGSGVASCGAQARRGWQG